jgi:hypothetical protein
MAAPPILQGHHALEFIRRIGLTLKEFERMTTGVDRGRRKWRAPLSEQEESFMNDAIIATQRLIALYEEYDRIVDREGTYMTYRTVPSNRSTSAVERLIRREADWFSRFSEFYTKKPYLFDFVDPVLTAEHVELLKKFSDMEESDLMERIIRRPSVDPWTLRDSLQEYQRAERSWREAAPGSDEQYDAGKDAISARGVIDSLLGLDEQLYSIDQALGPDRFDYDPNSGDEGAQPLPDAPSRLF